MRVMVNVVSFIVPPDIMNSLDATITMFPL